MINLFLDHISQNYLISLFEETKKYSQKVKIVQGKVFGDMSLRSYIFSFLNLREVFRIKQITTQTLLRKVTIVQLSSKKEFSYEGLQAYATCFIKPENSTKVEKLAMSVLAKFLNNVVKFSVRFSTKVDKNFPDSMSFNTNLISNIVLNMSSLRSLQLMNAQMLCQLDFALLATSTLTDLTIYPVNRGNIDSITKIRSLEKLSLIQGSGCSDDFEPSQQLTELPNITELKNLKQLKLSLPIIHVGVLESLSKLDKLQKLSIVSSIAIDDLALESISRIPQLESFSVVKLNYPASLNILLQKD